MSIRIISSGSIEGATRLAIVRLQTRSNLRKVDEPVDPAKQVIVGDMPLKAEAVEQRLLHHPPLAHHRPNLPRPSKRNQRTAPRSSGVFQRNRRIADIADRGLGRLSWADSSHFDVRTGTANLLQKRSLGQTLETIH